MAWAETHLPCPNCDSSDGYSIDTEGKGWCFVCETWTGNGDTVVTEKKPTNPNLSKGLFQALPDRDISLETCKFYGVLSKEGRRIYPYTNQDGVWTFNKVRILPKTFVTEGSADSLALFGQNKFSAGGKYLTITEGEEDTLAAYELMGSKYPVVSVRSSSGVAKECKANYEWLDSFSNIVVCFDADEPGQKAAQSIAELFGNKVKIVKMDSKLKDASGYKMAGKSKEFVDAWWRAEEYTPEGIVNGASLKDQIKHKKEVACIAGPWEEMDKLTYGFRLGEMWTLTAGSGMGKTQVLRELEHHFLKTTEYNIGGLFIEESVADSGEGLMSIECSKPLHLPDTEISEEEWDKTFQSTLATERVYYYDGFGESNVDKILSNIKFMVKAKDCKIIFLDHISIMVSEQANGDERKALDEIATKLKKLTMELDILLIMVSHSKRQATKPHEEGGQTSLSDLRGTAGIGQLSNIVLGLERNGQAEDLTERNTTLIRVLKNRFSGLTGPSSMLLYDKETGRLEEVQFNDGLEAEGADEDD